jgi:hypothetical protein
MRPTYETDDDLKRENEVLSHLDTIWNCHNKKLGKYYPADAAAQQDGDIKAFIEVRVRKNERLTYPTYLVSVHKLQELAELARFTQRPCFLVVQWLDALGYWPVPQSLDGLALDIGGTKRRNDAQDIEPCAFIPIDQFTLVQNESI